MRRAVLLVFVLVMVSFVCASELMVVDDIGDFSGAYLRLRASESGDLGDKIYPSEYLTNVGIVKFEFETSLSEVFFNIVFTKDGSVVNSVNKGPFEMNGSDVKIDLREIDEDLEVIKEVEVEEEVVNESFENVSNVSVVEVEVAEVDNESEVLVGLTGWAMQNVGSGSVVAYSVGGVILLFVVVFVIVLIRRRKGCKIKMGVEKSKVVEEPKKEVEKIKKKVEDEVEEIVDGDDMELREVEKRVKETEKRIAKLKESAKKRGKIEAARKKLAEEEEELRRLQGLGEEKKDEVERVEDLDSF